MLKPRPIAQGPGQRVVILDSTPDLADLDSAWEGEEEGPASLEDLDAGWDLEEERAAAADVAVGLDAGARRVAAERRASERKEKLRAKKALAQEKRRAHSESIRQKQKKPKKRASISPRRPASVATTSPGVDEVPRGASAPRGEMSRSVASPTVRRRRNVRILLLLIAFATASGAVAFVLSRS
jgi:hypothetical protein